MSSAATATILQVSSKAFSRVGTPNSIGAFFRMQRPHMGTFLAMFLKPASWHCWAPACLPRPMAIIFIRPLS